MIPEAFRNGSPSSDTQIDDEKQSSVIFRHADGNVLATVLPVFTPEQLVHFFGPATDLYFLAPSLPSERGNPIRHAHLPENLASNPQRGQLQLAFSQMREIEQFQQKLSVFKTIEFLHKMAPSIAREIGSKALFDNTTVWVQQALNLGIKSRAGVKKWSYLQMLTKGTMLNLSEVTALFKLDYRPYTADDIVDQLLRQAVNEKRGQT